MLKSCSIFSYTNPEHLKKIKHNYFENQQHIKSQYMYKHENQLYVLKCIKSLGRMLCNTSTSDTLIHDAEQNIQHYMGYTPKEWRDTFLPKGATIREICSNHAHIEKHIHDTKQKLDSIKQDLRTMRSERRSSDQQIDRIALEQSTMCIESLFQIADCNRETSYITSETRRFLFSSEKTNTHVHAYNHGDPYDVVVVWRNMDNPLNIDKPIHGQALISLSDQIDHTCETTAMDATQADHIVKQYSDRIYRNKSNSGTHNDDLPNQVYILMSDRFPTQNNMIKSEILQESLMTFYHANNNLITLSLHDYRTEPYHPVGNSSHNGKITGRINNNILDGGNTLSCYMNIRSKDKLPSL